jgi:hypothetical protein
MSNEVRKIVDAFREMAKQYKSTVTIEEWAKHSFNWVEINDSPSSQAAAQAQAEVSRVLSRED